MLMIDQNKYKGVFWHECEENSIGKFIYELFLQKIGQKPIAQNILISSKETPIEEIQAFLYRAVLCFIILYLWLKLMNHCKKAIKKMTKKKISP